MRTSTMELFFRLLTVYPIIIAVLISPEDLPSKGGKGEKKVSIDHFEQIVDIKAMSDAAVME